MYHHRAFTHHVAARTAVMEYIEAWYNRRGPRTSNGGVSPLAMLERYRAAEIQVLAV